MVFSTSHYAAREGILEQILKEKLSRRHKTGGHKHYCVLPRRFYSQCLHGPRRPSFFMIELLDARFVLLVRLHYLPFSQHYLVRGAMGGRFGSLHWWISTAICTTGKNTFNQYFGKLKIPVLLLSLGRSSPQGSTFAAFHTRGLKGYCGRMSHPASLPSGIPLRWNDIWYFSER